MFRRQLSLIHIFNKYLQSLSYTDNEQDETDDLQLTLDDREGVWLGSWLNTSEQKAKETPKTSSGDWKIGDEVTVSGRPQYSSYGDGNPGAALSGYKGKITYLNLKSGVPYPIQDVYKRQAYPDSYCVFARRRDCRTLHAETAY